MANAASTTGTLTAAASRARAERALNSASVNILVTLDCCCTSNAGDERVPAEAARSFELMAAIGKDKPAISPGLRSYTHALTKVLRALHWGDRPFTTADLAQSNNELQNNDSPFYLYSQLTSRARHICLAQSALIMWHSIRMSHTRATGFISALASVTTFA